jgi:hypothetical protein
MRFCLPLASYKVSTSLYTLYRKITWSGRERKHKMQRKKKVSKHFKPTRNRLEENISVMPSLHAIPPRNTRIGIAWKCLQKLHILRQNLAVIGGIMPDSAYSRAITGYRVYKKPVKRRQ